jgi:glucose/arabinose dehydrogenase
VFAPFGSAPGQRRIAGRVPCTSAVMRCNPDGSGLELFAWGLRNAFGLLVLPDGRLLATEQGGDERGSRRVGNSPDWLFEVRSGLWYGFPDYTGGLRVDDPRLAPSTSAAARPVIVNPGELPPVAQPLFAFPVNTSATKLDRIPDDAPRFAGQLVVCLFGDERPISGPPGPKVGRSVVRLDLDARALHAIPLDLALHRPIDVRVHAGFVYVLDFGHLEMAPGKLEATAGSGTVYRFPLAAL